MGHVGGFGFVFFSDPPLRFDDCFFKAVALINNRNLNSLKMAINIAKKSWLPVPTKAHVSASVENTFDRRVPTNPTFLA